MTGRVSRDFGLYIEEWGKYQVKKWVVCIFVFGLIILGFGCFYSLIKAYEKSKTIDEQDSFSSVKSEKLIQPIPLHEDSKEDFPRPFGMDFKQPIPSVFRVSSTTEKITTISYPQLARYRHNYQPRSIQDILRYTAPMMKPKSYEGMNMNGYQNQYTSSNMNQYPMNQNQYSDQQASNFGPNTLSSNHDPFYAYKPQDPSDINLMATASVRFAPPPWKNMNKHFPPNHQLGSNMGRDKFGRPTILTLHIFPMTERDKYMMGQYHGQINLFGKMMANREFQGRGENNMVIRLNMHPEALMSHYSMDRQEKSK